MSEHPDDLAGIETFVDIETDADQAWTALTTADGLAPWMGEGATIDARPGGLVALPDPVGGVTRRGRVDHIDDGRRLDFTWWPALRPADRTIVSIRIETAPDRRHTRVRVIETAAPGRSNAEALARNSLGPAPTTSPAALGSAVGWRASRSTIGLWSWRLAALTVAARLSRV